MTRFNGTEDSDLLPPLLGTVAALGDDRLDGFGGDDLLVGYTGDDILNGGVGADVLIGGVLTVTLGQGSATLAGSDTAYYLGSSAGVSINLSDTSDVLNLTLQGIDLELLDAVSGSGGDAAGDVLVGISNLTGSDHADTLRGDASENRLSGAGGDDLLYGLAGNDLLIGGDGDDRLEGGEGADTLLGGSHDDKLDGGLGDDVLDGGSGFDQAIYHGLASGVEVNLELGTATGGGGSDTLIDIEDVFGSAHDDQIVGTEIHGNRLEGSFGDDTILGLGGDDTLFGDDGADTLIGGTGDDTLVGGAGADILRGGDGRDDLWGGDDADDLVGGNGVDTLRGDAGNDVLDGGSGTDFLYGGEGADSFVFSSMSDTGVGQWQRDEVRDFDRAEGDVIDLTGIDSDSTTAGNQAFSFAGTAFSGSAGEMTLNTARVQGRDVYIASFDTDGDGRADGQILIDTDLIGASDFLL